MRTTVKPQTMYHVYRRKLHTGNVEVLLCRKTDADGHLLGGYEWCSRKRQRMDPGYVNEYTQTGAKNIVNRLNKQNGLDYDFWIVPTE